MNRFRSEAVNTVKNSPCERFGSLRKVLIYFGSYPADHFLNDRRMRIIDIATPDL